MFGSDSMEAAVKVCEFGFWSEASWGNEKIQLVFLVGMEFYDSIINISSSSSSLESLILIVMKGELDNRACT